MRLTTNDLRNQKKIFNFRIGDFRNALTRCKTLELGRACDRPMSASVLASQNDNPNIKSHLKLQRAKMCNFAFCQMTNDTNAKYQTTNDKTKRFDTFRNSISKEIGYRTMHLISATNDSVSKCNKNGHETTTNDSQVARAFLSCSSQTANDAHFGRDNWYCHHLMRSSAWIKRLRQLLAIKLEILFAFASIEHENGLNWSEQNAKIKFRIRLRKFDHPISSRLLLILLLASYLYRRLVHFLCHSFVQTSNCCIFLIAVCLCAISIQFFSFRFFARFTASFGYIIVLARCEWRMLRVSALTFFLSADARFAEENFLPLRRQAIDTQNWKLLFLSFLILVHHLLLWRAFAVLSKNDVKFLCMHERKTEKRTALWTTKDECFCRE